MHYNIPKVEVLKFQKDVEAQLDQIDQHLDLLRKTSNALQQLLEKGMRETDTITVMLPYSYETYEELEGVMQEAEASIFPTFEGRRPIIIVDTTGPVGKHMTWLKAAMKRLVYTSLVGKERFNLIKFTAYGAVRSLDPDA